MRIAVLSDTHDQLREEVLEVVETCDAVLHAGDICKEQILDRLSIGRPLYAVRGNNDHGWAMRLCACLNFELGGLNFAIAHEKKDLPRNLDGVDIVVLGHTHKYREEEKEGRLWLNPGSCGRRRFYQELTMAVLTVEHGAYQVEKLVFS